MRLMVSEPRVYFVGAEISGMVQPLSPYTANFWKARRKLRWHMQEHGPHVRIYVAKIQADSVFLVASDVQRGPDAG